MEAQDTPAESPGLTLKLGGDKGGGIEFSEHAVSNILNTLKEIVRDFIQWAKDDPGMFLIFLLFLGWTYKVHRKTGVEKAKLKVEYEKVRADERKAQQLRLPLDGEGIGSDGTKRG